MKTITKKIIASVTSTVLSLTAAAALMAPATPVFAASNYTPSSYALPDRDYNWEMAQYEIKKEEGITFLQNCVSDPCPAAIALMNEYVGVVETHPYNIAKTLEQNVNELIRYVNNVYKNIQTTDATCKLETYKAAKLEYLELLMDEREDLEVYNYVAYAFSYIVYEPGENLDVLMDHIDQLTAIAENAIVG